MKKLNVILIIMAVICMIAAGCAKRDAAIETGPSTEAAAAETEASTAAQETKAPKTYEEYEEFGKDAEWFYDNYGEPDEEEDSGEELILVYYDKNAEYGLSEVWELDKDGEIIDDVDPVTCCFRIDLKDGDDIVATVIHPDYEPEEETEEVQVLTPNPNGPY